MTLGLPISDEMINFEAGCDRAVLRQTRGLEREAYTTQVYANGVVEGRQRALESIAQSASRQPTAAMREARDAATRALIQMDEQRVDNTLVASRSYRDAFAALLKGGAPSRELRDLTSTVGSSGGYAVPASYYKKLIASLEWGTPVRQVAARIETPAGSTLTHPKVDDASVTANNAVILAEDTAMDTTHNPSFTQVTMYAWQYVAPVIALPISLDQDSGLDILSVLAIIASGRIGRGQNPHFTTGSGSGQPLGVTACAVGATSAGPTAVTLADLENLWFSLRAAYRPTSTWMLNSATEKAIFNLVDSQNRPQFPELREHGTLFSRPVVVNEDMPGLTASSISVVLGDFQMGYLIRDVANPVAAILRERWADRLQVAVVTSLRSDGNLQDPNALVSLQQHS